MKELKLFYLESCPYCKKARGYMEELKNENSKYAEIEITMIEEREQKELADSYDYFYVPTYYVGGQKVAEGDIDKAGVQKVFDAVIA